MRRRPPPPTPSWPRASVRSAPGTRLCDARPGVVACRLVVHDRLLVVQLVEHVLGRGLLVVLHALERGERKTLAREHHEPDADADRHLDGLEHEAEGKP